MEGTARLAGVLACPGPPAPPAPSRPRERGRLDPRSGRPLGQCRTTAAARVGRVAGSLNLLPSPSPSPHPFPSTPQLNWSPCKSPSPSLYQGWQGRRVARVAGRQKVATPSGSRGGKNCSGNRNKTVYFLSLIKLCDLELNPYHHSPRICCMPLNNMCCIPE